MATSGIRQKLAMTAVIGALLAPAVTTSVPALAQVSPATVVAEVVVYANVVVRKTVAVSPTTGARIEVLSVSRHARYDDLDLTEANDVAQLRDRIRLAAKDACAQLEREYPSALYPPTPSDQDCVKSAIAQATPLANAVIAASR